MTFLLPVIKASGPSNAKLLVVGEAPGETEELMGLPFVGSSGQELRSMLSQAGIDHRQAYFTNVLWSRPPANKLEAFCVPKKEAGGQLVPVSQGKYLHPSLLPEVDRLRSEILSVRPNLVLALGNLACWALLGQTGITRIRGTIAESKLVPGLKVLPTFHPANVMRQFENRVIVMQDLAKVKHEMEFSDIHRPKRIVTIDPTVEEIEAFVPLANAAPFNALDVETSHQMVTMLGVAISPSRGIVIPFAKKGAPGHHYWPSVEIFARVLRAVRQIVCHPSPKKIFQNGLYDVQYLWKMGMPVMIDEDTMILHHSLFPELQKGLGFLGSIYTNEASWKLLRHKSDTTKLEDE